MPRSMALWITLREPSRSMRWPKLLQPKPTAETRKPEPPRLRICMDASCEVVLGRSTLFGPRRFIAQAGGAIVHCKLLGFAGSWPRKFAAWPDRRRRHHKKVRPRSDAATDGDRWGRVIVDGGLDQTHGKASRAL